MKRTELLKTEFPLHLYPKRFLILWLFLLPAILVNTSCYQLRGMLPGPSNVPLTTPQLAGLRSYIQNTPLTVVLTQVQVETEQSDYETKHKITAKIQTLIKSPDSDVDADPFTFEMITENGELILFEKAVLISLCDYGDKWFWAGSGSVFPANDYTISQAESIAAEILAVPTQPTTANRGFC